MKILNLFLGLGLMAGTAAANENLSVEDFCQRLQINADVYVYDLSGTKFLNDMGERWSWNLSPLAKGEQNGCTLNAKISSSTSVFGGKLIMRSLWTINADGELNVTIEQYRNETKDHDGLDLLGKETYAVKNMAPVVWKSLLHKDQNVVIRYIPSLRVTSGIQDLNQIPIAGKDMIVTDHLGRVWAQNMDVSGNFVGITMLHGTVLMSYYPFKEAELIGKASGDQIVLRPDDKTRIDIRSSAPFLPVGVEGKVYGRYIADKKSKGLNSQQFHTSSTADKFEERIDRM
ncbi:MAG: hypothetical protein AB7T49_11585 [Oligoflexales bacterium]